VIAHCCYFDKSGKQLVVGCSDGEIKVINLESNQVASTFKAHEGAVNDLVINQDNEYVYSCGNDGTIRSWK
jgi:WD40 repeat protein